MTPTRSKWRVGLVGVAIGLLIGVSGYHFVYLPHSNRQDTSSDLIVEGERFGHLRLGMNLAQVRGSFTQSFDFASSEGDSVNRYVWRATTGSWQVFVHRQSSRVVAIAYFPLFSPFDRAESFQEHEERLGGIPFTAKMGARYGHGLETVLTIYGPPTKKYRRAPRVLTYYYANFRTEFLFGCSMTAMKDPCSDYDWTVEQIRIYARDWSPERLWGPDYAKGN